MLDIKKNCQTWTNFGWTLENFFLTWKIFVGHEILVKTKIFGHGRFFFFLLGMGFWLEQIFGHGKIFVR